MGKLLLVPILAAATAIGAAAGIGSYAFLYARGASYLTDDPEACANCHVMRDHHDGWRKASHHAVAVCNDCHTPHGLVSKYLVKAENGFHHSLAFTSGNFPTNIRARDESRAVVEEQCRRCHAAVVDTMLGPYADADTSCIKCHASVGHPR